MQIDQSDRGLLIVAGEASGDLHGARLLAALRELDPRIRAFGLGGGELQAAGMEVIARSSEISVVGITEVARILPRARQIFQLVLAEVDQRSTRTALLIDFPDFNLRLAKALKRRDVRILYYISPQVWAWRKGRVRTISKLIDRMLVILPFEVDFFRRHGVETVHVGHPLVDEVPELPHRWDLEQSQQEPLQIALLPGSRASEIDSNLPVMLEAATRLCRRFDCQFRLIKASTIDERTLAGPLARTGLSVEVVRGDRFAVIADSHLAICASGTATLEVGLLRTPMIVVYRVSAWTYLLGRLLVRLPHIALVNLVLGKRAVPELIQHAATADGIADTAAEILGDRGRIRAMRDDLGGLRGQLGLSGASQRAASEVFKELGKGTGSNVGGVVS